MCKIPEGEDDKDKLFKTLRKFGLREENYDWYIDLRRCGTLPHVEFRLGVERLLTWMLDLENIILMFYYFREQ